MADPAQAPILDSDTVSALSEADEDQPVQRVAASEVLKMYRLRHLEHLTFDQIAHATGWSIGTVHHYVTQVDEPTVEYAEKLLKHRALDAASVSVDLLEHDDPKLRHSAARTVLQSAGLLTPQTQVNVGVQVIHGTPGTPAGYDPFEAKVVETSHTTTPAKS